MNSNYDALGIVSDIFNNGYSLTPLIAYSTRFLFRNPYDSMIIVNKDRKIEFIDKGTERFFGLSHGEAKGLDISSLIPGSSIPLTIKTGKPILGKVFEIKDKKGISTAYPIIKDGTIIGALSRLTLYSLEEVERLNSEIERLSIKIQYLKQKDRNQHNEHDSVYTFDDILGLSPALQNLKEIVQKLSVIDTDILIVGESGTGKELFGHSIHSYAHKGKPFVKINCPAIPFELAESELFGYEKGAFSGALTSGKAGKFEIANNGVVFLDEVSSLPLSIQAKLLRVIQEREVERLGSTKPKKLRFKLISTTNIDLKALTNDGKFREDLYYRIAKTVINLPPLRKRKEDIPLYLSHFLQKINESFKTRAKNISKRAMVIFMAYPWPGNLRELINVTEQVVINAWNDEEIDVRHLPEDLKTGFRDTSRESYVQNIRNVREEIKKQEIELIYSTIKSVKGNKKKASLLLGIPRSSLYEKIKRYKIKHVIHY